MPPRFLSMWFDHPTVNQNTYQAHMYQVFCKYLYLCGQKSIETCRMGVHWIHEHLCFLMLHLNKTVHVQMWFVFDSWFSICVIMRQSPFWFLRGGKYSFLRELSEITMKHVKKTVCMWNHEDCENLMSCCGSSNANDLVICVNRILTKWNHNRVEWWFLFGKIWTWRIMQIKHIMETTSSHRFCYKTCMN